LVSALNKHSNAKMTRFSRSACEARQTSKERTKLQGTLYRYTECCRTICVKHVTKVLLLVCTSFRQGQKTNLRSIQQRTRWVPSRVQAEPAIFLIDIEYMRQPLKCWQYCQNQPIRWYSSSCYTRRGSYSFTAPRLSPPSLFLARFRSSPTTENLEQVSFFFTRFLRFFFKLSEIWTVIISMF